MAAMMAKAPLASKAQGITTTANFSRPRVAPMGRRSLTIVAGGAKGGEEGGATFDK